MEKREEKRDNTRSVNQSHAAPDNQPTTIPHRCDHLSFLLQRSPSFPRTRSIQLSLGSFPLSSFPPRRTDDTIVPLSIYIPFSLALRVHGPRSTPYAHIYRRAFVRSTSSNFSLFLLLSLSLPFRRTVGILLSFSLSLSTSNFPPCHTLVLFLALVLPRSDGAPADFAFKFGKFAGVGK